MRSASPFFLSAAAAAALSTGCATRALPLSFPATAAASPSAAAGTIAAVDGSLRADPPLPGESTAGWPGLEEPGTAAAPPASSPAPHPPGVPPTTSGRAADRPSGGHHAH